MTYFLKALKVFKANEKYKVGIIFIFSIIAAFLEMVGITLAIPVLTILLEGNLENDFFNNINLNFDFIKNIYKENLLYASLIILVFGFF